MLKEYLLKQKLRSKLLQAFKSGQIYNTYKKDNTTRYIMPKIQAVDVKKERMYYVFSIPLGFDPKEVLKKEWLFKQQFGDNIKLEQKNKVFTLTVYADSLPKELTYNYEAINKEEMSLPIVCGVDQKGKMIVYDMVKHPHLLIAGETGSGKSTQIRAILTTLIKYCDPSMLRLHLGDMKRSEFHLFRNVDHVDGVYTKVHELENMLVKLKKELEDRGDLLDKYEVTHIDDCNELTDEKKPYLLICIDEVALLKKENKIMEVVEDISAIGRALGVFLILSMQRPDAKVLDGKLKNNLTVRMGFKASNAINARIVDTPGSEKIGLDQSGRMILKLYDLEEIQAPYLTDTKAKKLLQPYKVEKPKEVVEESPNEEEDVREELKKLFGGEETCEKEISQSLITWQDFDV